MKTLLVIMASVALQACTIGAEVAEDDKGKFKRCVDIRYGESFIVNTDDIYKARAGFGGSPSYVKFKTIDGRDMTVTSEMTWLKCKEYKLSPSELTQYEKQAD